jgi:hypothetical protein
MVSATVREFFRELFGSRLITNLEVQLLQLRQDYERRLQDKDQVIAELRTEYALMRGRMSIYENTIMPLASRAGAQIVAATTPKPLKPNFSPEAFVAQLPKSRWEVVQEEHEKELARLEAEEAAKKTGV